MAEIASSFVSLRIIADNNNEKDQPEYTGEKGTQKSAILKTVLIWVVWICIGIMNEIPGSTMQDLMWKIGISYTEAARALSGKGVGYLIGIILVGVLEDTSARYGKLIMGSALMLEAASCAVIPWCIGVTTAWIAFMVQGFAEGAIILVGPNILLQLWGVRVVAPLQFLMSGMGIGGLTIPQIVLPSLGDWVTLPKNATLEETNLTTPLPSFNHTVGNTRELEGSRIEWTYLAIGIAVGVYSLVFYIWQFCFNDSYPRKEKLKNDKKTINKKRRLLNLFDLACHHSRLKKIFIVAFASFLTLHSIGGLRAVGKFVYSYAIDELQFPPSSAASLNTAFWIGLTFSRIFSFVVSMKIAVNKIYIFVAMFYFVSMLVMYFFGGTSTIVTWIFIVAGGIFKGPMYSSAIGWANLYIDLSGVGIAIVVLSGTVGDMIYTTLTGVFFDQHPQNLINILLTEASFILATGVAFAIISRNFEVRGHEETKCNFQETEEMKTDEHILSKGDHSILGDETGHLMVPSLSKTDSVHATTL